MRLSLKNSDYLYLHSLIPDGDSVRIWAFNGIGALSVTTVERIEELLESDERIFRFTLTRNDSPVRILLIFFDMMAFYRKIYLLVTAPGREICFPI